LFLLLLESLVYLSFSKHCTIFWRIISVIILMLYGFSQYFSLLFSFIMHEDLF